MAAPNGNQFWLMRSSHGRNPIFENPEDLLDACFQYFEWVEKNPLNEEIIKSYKGKNKRVKVKKMRAMTMTGLNIFLGISSDTWANYRKKDDFIAVTKQAENIIYEQKFTGASADLLNANIIARDLGLADKKELSGAVSIVIDEQDDNA